MKCRISYAMFEDFFIVKHCWEMIDEVISFQVSRSNGKQKDGESAKLLRLKKYLKVAGIKIQNYSKLFEDCKSKKSKETKLLELLESKGLKGIITLSFLHVYCDHFK